MYPRHRLDLTARQLAYAGAACLWARDERRRAERVEQSSPDGALVCFSVRSSFELLLDALALPRGSEVLMSAITHPDMSRIVSRHELLPVPLELDLETLQPRLDSLEQALTTRTRAVVVAHLFGARADLASVIAFCRSHDLVLIEDCAQTLRGPDDSGDPASDVALFSFGSIKTAPALGGAIAYVRDSDLRARMSGSQDGWPAQGRGEYALRVLRFSGLLALGHPSVYELFVRAGRRVGLDVDALVNRSVHALKPQSGENRDEFGKWLRRRPSAPLLALLTRRLAMFDHDRLRLRAERGELAAAALPRGLFHPGRKARERTHWVFPVATPHPERLIGRLREAGFDATAATSSISAIEAPADRPLLRPEKSIRFMEQVVFVPAYPELSERAFRRLLETLGRLEDERLGEVGVAVEPGETVRR